MLVRKLWSFIYLRRFTRNRCIHVNQPFNAMQETKWAKEHWAKTTTRLPAINNM